MPATRAGPSLLVSLAPDHEGTPHTGTGLGTLGKWGLWGWGSLWGPGGGLCQDWPGWTGQGLEVKG